ncbi:uncharacterized protein K452DRAFT_319009 [Aplosporella prunicola CBS 121167]|uniref:UmuC domain-containing protein n=1 Tax=Aplosporella prunicola CBS 121167 TaxID=1176127 RepID=A0A6A6BAW2_9PEZI|nr:uncharacterized protein K452DRAFT_319009 [Aplosporella prunicola CBS 121167]KAF2141382.1 hypothetical protein K452DRAFT_319009 [Aplosporella prunicola CBS 121167]
MRALSATRVVMHFDYDAFYCSCLEADEPQLRFLPLAVQRKCPHLLSPSPSDQLTPALTEKQIVVTCNYEARRRGLHKLQPVKEAKRLCPDLVIVLGEDLTRFRDYSKALYRFLRHFSWNRKVERLGFDEVWMDVTDQLDYNVSLLNPNDLTKCFFHLSRDDPTSGFDFDATVFAGNTWPASEDSRPNGHDIREDPLRLRLLLASNLAHYIRRELEHHKGFTATAGVSTSKLLSKLVGSVKKPNSQTTLLPPCSARSGDEDACNTIAFIDTHDIGKIPGIGFKIAEKLREHVLRPPPDFDPVPGQTDMNQVVRARDVRLHPGTNAEALERLLGGSGSPRGIGVKVWNLIHGFDDQDVGQAKDVPSQISIEDSYIRLDSYNDVVKELRALTTSLLKRMRLDLLEEESENSSGEKGQSAQSSTAQKNKRRWLAYPRTIRLSTRPRLPADAASTNQHSRPPQRISRSAPLPSFAFNQSEDVDALAQRLVTEALIPLFRRLHPDKRGWNLSLINVAVTNMAGAAAEGKDIGGMFKRLEREDAGTGAGAGASYSRDRALETAHKEQAKATREDEEASDVGIDSITSTTLCDAAAEEAHAWPRSLTHLTSDVCLPGSAGSEDVFTASQASNAFGRWEEDDDGSSADGGGDAREGAAVCELCGAVMPAFAVAAHGRFHELGD